MILLSRFFIFVFMEVTTALVEKLAHLSRLYFTEEEMVGFTARSEERRVGKEC